MLIRLLALTTLLFTTPAALADWKLVGDASQISFVSVKKGTIAETHHFKALEGQIADSGTATLSIPLASVETNIPIRNERMQKLLFETTKYARASVNAKVDAAKLQAMQPGQTATLDAELQLSIHGSEHSEAAKLQVTGLKDNRLLVSTESPIVLNAADFKLLEGIEKLRQIAGLDTISPIVPVSAQLVFAKE
ncbi:YceI family protein [Microbulbifer litoralis]|uniref:YceI family protein n=1 Tax=Microbulbifer litoralis TaxID=2933965 RepID=UPI0020296C24|nr:YceI family protein [Microbulbifer sp. GX H0434]